MNTHIRDDQRGVTYKVLVGLLCGHRNTNFINTLFNDIYFDLGVLRLEHLAQLVVEVTARAHQGDYLLGAFANVLHAYLWLFVMRNMGFVLSQEKQIEAVNILELLKKVWIDGLAATSAPRRLINLINRNVEGSQFILIESAVRRIHDMCWKCRGANH